MKKSILITSQSLQSGRICNPKPVGFASLDFDGIKITIDAYNDKYAEARPRENCLITIVDEKEVFELEPETLLEIIRFYADYSASVEKINRYRNRYHYIASTPSKEG